MRLIAAHMLGVKTASEYPEGAAGLPYLRAVRAADHAPVLKTHRRVSELVTDRVLVVVRDPRAVAQSLQRFYQDYNGQHYTLLAIVNGWHPWGSWSEWVTAWREHAPGALWLRYEDIVADPWRAAEQISAHFDLGAPDGALPEFGALHSLDPRMWRRGRPDPEPLAAVIEDAIIEQHGDAMRAFGYA